MFYCLGRFEWYRRWTKGIWMKIEVPGIVRSSKTQWRRPEDVSDHYRILFASNYDL